MVSAPSELFILSLPSKALMMSEFAVPFNVSRFSVPIIGAGEFRYTRFG